jgi:hypothetical protein
VVLAGDRHRRILCRCVSLLLYPLKDHLTVPFEGTKAFLHGAQHPLRQIGGPTLLNGVLNDLALAGNMSLAFGDVPINVG